MGISTSKYIYGHGFGPFISGTYIAPFPYAPQLPKGMNSTFFFLSTFQFNFLFFSFFLFF